MTILHGDEIRSGMLFGIDALADAVKVTLGPRGRYAAMPQKANLHGADYGDEAAPDAPVLVTNDGVTIAKSIVLPDPVHNMGAQLCKQAAIAANDVAGDGTTTAVVLTQALLHGALQCVAAGGDPLALRRGIQAAGAAVRECVGAQARAAETKTDLARVASVSCRDDELGDLVAEALDRVGAEGVVSVDDSRTYETVLDVQEGIVFDRGLISPHMATDSQRGIAELENPYILLTDQKITDRDDIIDALICAAEDGRDCLIVCDGIEGDALALVLGNNRAGGMHVACVLAPEYGEGRIWRLDDLAVQVGGIFIAKGAGLRLRDASRAALGSAARVSITAKRTTITGGGGNAEAIAERISQLRYYVANTDYEFNRKRHAERLAKFVSGVAVVRVGGATEVDQWERKMRVEDALAAAMAARDEGIVAGGGAALAHAAQACACIVDELEGDERRGAEVALAACKAPLLQIAWNAGAEGAVVAQRVADGDVSFGYDARGDRCCDMFEAGIVDPLRVTHGALDAAFSVAGTALLTEAGVVQKRVEDSSADGPASD